MRKEELIERTKSFAHRCVKLAVVLPKTALGNHIKRQLIRCSTSVAANYRAACHGQTKAAFVQHTNREDRCFYRLRRPFIPKKPDTSIFENKINYKDRRFKFTKSNDGVDSTIWLNAVFLRQDCIVYFDPRESDEPIIFEGDWRLLVKGKIRYIFS